MSVIRQRSIATTQRRVRAHIVTPAVARAAAQATVRSGLAAPASTRTAPVRQSVVAARRSIGRCATLSTAVWLIEGRCTRGGTAVDPPARRGQ